LRFVSLLATASVKAGQPLTVTWSGAADLKCDWIGVYAAADPDL